MNAPGLCQAIILAGGRGTRLGSITENIPKPLVDINGRPFLGYLIDQLQGQGIEDILLLTGYLGDQIEDYCGDGSHWGVKIRCIESPVEFETGKRIRHVSRLIASNFLLMYCDNYWPMNLSDMWSQYIAQDIPAQITVYSNEDNYTKNNVHVDQNGFVRHYDPKRQADQLNGVEVGYAIMSRSVLDYLSADNIAFSHAVYPRLASESLLKAYQTNHRYYSIGSKDRLPITQSFLKPQMAVILDRDGTLNERPDQAQYITRWEDFQWLPGVIEALGLLQDSGYKLIVVSNQAGIARGELTEEQLNDINVKMKEDLSGHGINLDGLYYCPHGWDEGCICRKPQPGMLFQAQRDFLLDLSNTLFIGDDERDALAGQAAGCLTMMVSEGRPLLTLVKEYLSKKP